MGSETYIVHIVESDGKRFAERYPLNIPLGVARGHYERLSDLALREMTKDLLAERERRDTDGSAVLTMWDPKETE